MSMVSGITLQISCAEDYIEQKEGKDVIPIIEQINKWLFARHFQPLASVEDHYSGSKMPQVLVYGAGYNYFPEDEFAEYIQKLIWRLPENVVLLINPEDGATKVIRPRY